jgi:predicted dienelactone hydrolase
VVFSHYSGGHRWSATFLCTHLASHGYVVAAVDHSEVVAAELAPRAGETPGERRARIDAVIGSRVPDVRFLLDYLLDGQAGGVVLDRGTPLAKPHRLAAAGRVWLNGARIRL